MKKVKNKQQNAEMTIPDSDETFYYIAGYTDGGAPYGVTWEEMEKEATGEITGVRDRSPDSSLVIKVPNPW